MDRNQLVNQSIDYIMQHLDEDLSVESVAGQFFISKYHFSRIFKAVTGESVYAFMKRCKVDQSAVDMKSGKIDYRHWPGLWIQFFQL